MSSWSDQNAIFIAIEPEKLLAITAYGEAASEGVEGLMAVVNVILNRTKDLKQFGDQEILSLTGSPVHAVALKYKQFSMFNPSDPVRSRALTFANNFESSVQSNSTLAKAYEIGQMAMSNMLADNTGGATHYFNPSIVIPTWASSMDLIGSIGNHRFFSVLPSWQRVREIASSVVTSPNTKFILLAIAAGFVVTLINRRR